MRTPRCDQKLLYAGNFYAGQLLAVALALPVTSFVLVLEDDDFLTLFVIAQNFSSHLGGGQFGFVSGDGGAIYQQQGG